MSAEQWRPVVGFPDYQVSDQGRVVSHKRPEKPLLMRQFLDSRGYFRVTFSIDDKTYTRSVHRLVAEAFHGPAQEGQVLTRHLNGNPVDNRAENVVWGTPAENLFDAVAHGTHGSTRKTHCPQGHAYDEANTRVYRRWRYCIACQRSRPANAARDARRALARSAA